MTNEAFKKTKLPDKPGVYFFLKGKSTRAGGEILYIGKATSLRDRVKSYFGKDLIETRGPVLVDMLFRADKIDWQETDSVLEALILEANLIKKHQPKYNTKEKSDKSFNYVCVTKDKKIAIVRGKNIKNTIFDKIYGPFPNSSQLREALRIIRKIFPYFEDKKNTKGKNEFYKQIKLIPENLIENKNNIKNIKLFFEGKKKKILQNLKKEMALHAKRHEFEKAGEVKRQIFALQHINDVALIKNGGRSVFERTLGRSGDDGQRKFPVGNFRGESENTSSEVMRVEAYDIAHMGGKNMVGVMTVVEDGEVSKSEYKKFKIRTQSDANDTGALKEVLERRFLHTEWPYPSFIVVDGGIAQINVAKAVLAKLNAKIGLVSVLKDEKHKPKAVMGDRNLALKYQREILLANSEAHRFAIAYHKNMRNKNFLRHA